MDEKLLKQILSHTAFTSKPKGKYIASDDYEVSVILATHSASSVTKVKTIELDGELCTLSTAESTYLMPWSQIFAIRISEQGAVQSSRTGFHA